MQASWVSPRDPLFPNRRGFPKTKHQKEKGIAQCHGQVGSDQKSNQRLPLKQAKGQRCSQQHQFQKWLAASGNQIGFRQVKVGRNLTTLER